MSFNLAAALPQTTLWAMFVGGLVAFLSPCVLPMLPVYGLYLVGEGSDTADRRGAWVGVLKRSLGLLAVDRVPSLQAMLAGGAMGYRGDVPALCRGAGAGDDAHGQVRA